MYILFSVSYMAVISIKKWYKDYYLVSKCSMGIKTIVKTVTYLQQINCNRINCYVTSFPFVQLKWTFIVNIEYWIKMSAMFKWTKKHQLLVTLVKKTPIQMFNYFLPKIIKGSAYENFPFIDLTHFQMEWCKNFINKKQFGKGFVKKNNICVKDCVQIILLRWILSFNFV